VKTINGLLLRGGSWQLGGARNAPARGFWAIERRLVPNTGRHKRLGPRFRLQSKPRPQLVQAKFAFSAKRGNDQKW
jgi:hypothetical protein